METLMGVFSGYRKMNFSVQSSFHANCNVRAYRAANGSSLLIPNTLVIKLYNVLLLVWLF